VAAVLDQVSLSGDADRRVGGYSLGMRQRLGLAAALLGDPQVLILDEPGNGLDPAGMAWLRNLLRDLAAEGRTVVISSHVLAEVAQTVDQVVIVNAGRLRFAGPLRELDGAGVTVRTSQAGRLRTVLLGRGYQVEGVSESTLIVHRATGEEIGRLATDAGITLSALTDASASLEAAFLRLTAPVADPPIPAGAPIPADLR
jgi:ABC-2 type transport system ATP-binding protein